MENHWSCSNIINYNIINYNIIELHWDIAIFYDIIVQYQTIINFCDRVSALDCVLGPGLISRNLISGAN